MIYYESIPLFEASLFLANKAIGVSWTSYMEKTFRKGNNYPNSAILEPYSKIMIDLERRLNASITVSEDVVQTLFAPLYQQGKDDYHPSSGYICNMLLPGVVEAYVDWKQSEFFNNLRRDIRKIPGRILEFLDSASCCENEDISIHELFSKINSSDLPQNSKLVLTDLALNTERYLDMIEETLSPVAEEFIECQELIAPLLKHFQNRYEHETAEEIVDRLWRGDRANIKQVIVCPSVVCSNYAVIAFNSSKTVLLGCIGSLYEYLRENFALARNPGIKLTQTLAALSNRNRFNIIAKLLDGPAYGRELASFVGISPVTISQHISILLSANLITMHNDGTKTYYSLNTEELDRFIDSFRKYFRRDQ
ncbi:MAG: ArsR/SmtB family transcription factor [Faecousia sp.]